MPTKEQHYEYGKSLGLWSHTSKPTEPNVDRKVARINAMWAEHDETELRKKREKQQASLREETPHQVNNTPILKSTLLKNEENMNALGKGSFSSLSLGMKSFEVLKAQEALKEVSVYQGKVDGSFGSETEQAVKKFQQLYVPTHSIHTQYVLNSTDGVIDKNTVLALDEAIIEQWDGSLSLEPEVLKATEDLLRFLPTLNLESSVHSQAVKEFSEAFDVILKGYNEENITYEIGYDLIYQVKNGFVEGAEALQITEKERQRLNSERDKQTPQDSSYRRNLTVNNESFNVRFKASCATPECLMRNANIDMEDHAFQDYIEAATQDKRSDVMQVIGVALIVNPYLIPLQRIVLADVAESATKGNFDPALAYAMGAGVAYRLRLLNFSNRTQATSESVASYFSGNVLSDDK
ncbi:peptidoglycan-binding protein [Vibrio sp. 10N.261.46.A3]|uniref:peptidoglycan-binding domain-containing protein n=1 Tax=Vibrio sp. 10N.261.46.A3 TaxID=3229658 RepID=UPI003551E7C5